MNRLLSSPTAPVHASPRAVGLRPLLEDALGLFGAISNHRAEERVESLAGNLLEKLAENLGNLRGFADVGPPKRNA